MRPRARVVATVIGLGAVSLSACSSDTPAAPATTSTTTSTLPATTTSTSTTSTTTTTSTTSTTTTTIAPTLADIDDITEVAIDRPLEIGRSVLGQPIEVIRRGDPDGVRVLVIGVIHGDESAGLAIIDELERLDLPGDVELWLVPSMNPDGERSVRRHNANGVDLNRNFPQNWAPLAQPGSCD